MVLVRALIFDMDGVLIHSNPWHARVWREFCRRHGLEIPEDQIQWMYGRRNDEIVRAWFGGHRSEAEIQRLGREKESLFRKTLEGRVSEAAVPGVQDLLRRHDSYPAAVASQAERENVEFVIRGLGLQDRFRGVCSGSEVRRPKPDPEIYRRAAAAVDAEPGACLAFEDTAAGVQAARAAGMRVVGISTTTPDLPGADLVAEDFRAPQLHHYLAAVLGGAPVPGGCQR